MHTPEINTAELGPKAEPAKCHQKWVKEHAVGDWYSKVHGNGEPWNAENFNGSFQAAFNHVEKEFGHFEK